MIGNSLAKYLGSDSIGWVVFSGLANYNRFLRFHQISLKSSGSFIYISKWNMNFSLYLSIHVQNVSMQNNFNRLNKDAPLKVICFNLFFHQFMPICQSVWISLCILFHSLNQNYSLNQNFSSFRTQGRHALKIRDYISQSIMHSCVISTYAYSTLFYSRSYLHNIVGFHYSTASFF